MIYYLEKYYNKTKSDDVGSLLRDLSQGHDPEIENGWKESILKIKDPNPTPCSTRLFINSDIILYHNRDYLDTSLTELENEAYKIYKIDGSCWKDTMDFHHDVARILEFPSYYGENLNAFNDCLSDIFPSHALLALVFLNYDVLARIDFDFSRDVLDIIQCQSRNARLQGTHLCSLVQTNDSSLMYKELGAVDVQWNSDEWQESSRG
ncbi:hypothetical protein GCM10008968_12450 [Bacillus horti]